MVKKTKSATTYLTYRIDTAYRYAVDVQKSFDYSLNSIIARVHCAPSIDKSYGAPVPPNFQLIKVAFAAVGFQNVFSAS